MTKFHVKVIFLDPKSLLCILLSLQRPLCVIGRLGKSKHAGQLCIHDVFVQSIFFVLCTNAWSVWDVLFG